MAGTVHDVPGYPSRPDALMRRNKGDAWVKAPSRQRLKAFVDDPEVAEQERMARYLAGKPTARDVQRTLDGDPPWR